MVISGRSQQWADVWKRPGIDVACHTAHRDELQSFAAKSGVSLDLLTVANTIMDLHRAALRVRR